MTPGKLRRLFPALAIPLTARNVMAQGEQTIWFFGNSYTDQQGLTGFAQCWYESYARNALNISHVETPRHTVGDATLGSHLDYLREDPDAPFFMDGKDYPWVVLQEQSLYPSVPALLEDSIESARALNFFFWVNQVQDVMFLMTWGRRDGFSGLEVSYPDFLSHNRALLDGYMAIVDETSTASIPRYMAPCGLTFETIYNDCVDRGVDPLNEVECLFPKLYATDGSHPSRLGAYACGATIATAMTGDDPMLHECYPTTDDPIYDSEGTAVRAAVAKTIIDTFNSGLIKYPFHTLWTTATPTQMPLTLAPTTPPSSITPTHMPLADPTHAPTTVEPMQSTTTIAPIVLTAAAATASPTTPPTTTTNNTTATMVVAVDRTPSDAMPSLSQEENLQDLPVGLTSEDDAAIYITVKNSSSGNVTRWAALHWVLQMGQALAFLLLT